MAISGPNCWLWNPRNFIPQQGKSTIADMSRAHAISWMDAKDLHDIKVQMETDEEFAENSGWIYENLVQVCEAVKNFAKDLDTHRTILRRAGEEQLRD